MPTPATHDDPFDAFDDQDDEFVTDYKSKLDVNDDDLTLDEPFEQEIQAEEVREHSHDVDPFTDAFDEPLGTTMASPLQRQALSNSTLGLSAPAMEIMETAFVSDDDIGVISIPRIGIHFFPENEISTQA